MTPEALARAHAESFTAPPPWSAAAFAGLLDDPACFLLAEGTAFVLGRAAAGEAELLTIAVPPALRRQGIAGRLVAQFLAAARARGAGTAFLEVAAGNAAARALYLRAGFAEAGRRPRYYRHPDGRTEDALVMSRPLDGGALPTSG
ncbi:ribosomal protein S18-alanine N-acetyltransferase [Frigidibacter sp. MR17.24]|uniref:ribosomal protein S18-alanine N-acetyltransferase n=1 Tax=Frigidibacter sp. MR17.24 TaxID=3127345 RepID=UPI003012A914